MNECEGVRFPFTIEQQLKRYAECPGHNERHEILWNEWKHNKRWLTQVQEMILLSFPSYSKHDATHSEAVLQKIELVLGEKNIRELSPTDCYILLNAVYIHDIGMCITHEDRACMASDNEFIDFVQTLTESQDEDMCRYARLLMGALSDETVTTEKMKVRLEIYYAIIYIMADFQRRKHGQISKERLLSWIEKKDKLGMGYSTIDIPNRLLQMIGNIAGSHSASLDTVMGLETVDTGFANDYVHPRFLAVLLQLGDALDMDNGRFHPLTKEYLGQLPESSEVHFRKHRAIQRLFISNQELSLTVKLSS